MRYIIRFVMMMLAAGICIPAAAQVCVGETVTYICPGTSTKFTWGVSGGGVRNPASGNPCTITVTWNTPGNHTVTYSDILDFQNDEIYNVTVVTANAGTVSASLSTVCLNENSVLTVSGYAGAIQRWEKSTGSGWTTIAHTGSSYTATALQQTTQFRVVVTSCGSTVTSAPKTVTVTTPQPGSIAAVSGSPVYCEGNPTSFTLEWSPNTPGNGSILKKWQTSTFTNGSWSAWTDVGGQHQVNTQEFFVSAPTRIRAVERFASCNADSYTGFITTGPQPATQAGSIASSAGGQAVCAGQTFSLSLNGNVGTVLQWYARDEEHEFALLPSVTNISINRPFYYKAVVQNGSCPSAETPVFYMDVKRNSGALFPAVQSICSGKNAVFTIHDFEGTSIQWQRKNAGEATWTTVATNTQTQFAYGPVTTSGAWRAIIVNDCEQITTAEVAVTVITHNTPVTAAVSVCPGQDVTLSVSNPQTAVFRYNWYIVDNGQYSLQRVTLQNEFKLSNVSSNQTYYVAFENNGCVGPLSAIAVNVFNAASVPQTPYTVVTAEPTYTVMLHMNNVATGSVTYYWQTSSQGKSQNSSASTITMPAAGLYYVQGKNSSGCWGGLSEAVEVINHTPPVYTTNTSAMNYVRTYTFQYPSTRTSLSANRDEEPNSFKLETGTVYLDGFGRESQTVLKRNSPIKMDMVTPVDYDAGGRLVYQYLPYAETDGSGQAKVNTLAQQRLFYSGTQAGGATSYFPFSYNDIERAPLEKIQKTYAPGAAWSGLAGSAGERSLSTHDESNAANEVILWSYTPPNGPSNPDGEIVSGTANSPAYFAARQLTRSVSKDEQGHAIITYHDKDGRVILKRVQVVEGNVAVNDTNYASTYYVYDISGNLVAVLPPEAVKSLLLSN